MENIGIIINTLNTGGAERAAANLSKDLSAYYHVYLLVCNPTDICYPYSGEIIDLGTRPAKSRIGKLLNFIRRISRLWCAKKKYQFKVCISFMPSANFMNVITRQHEKVISSIRCAMSMSPSVRKSEGPWLIRYTGKHSDITVALSEGVKTDLIENFGYDPQKLTVIYNSCEREWFFQKNPAIEKQIQAFDFSSPCLVTVGRLSEQKGQWHLLRAFSIVLKTLPNCKLVIFGDGNLRSSLERYAAALGVSEHIFWMGYVKNHHAFLERCDAFVFSSIYEGLGNVLLEALACGLPVISSDCPFGPREILNPDAVSPISGID